MRTVEELQQAVLERLPPEVSAVPHVDPGWYHFERRGPRPPAAAQLWHARCPEGETLVALDTVGARAVSVALGGDATLVIRRLPRADVVDLLARLLAGSAEWFGPRPYCGWRLTERAVPADWTTLLREVVFCSRSIRAEQVMDEEPPLERVLMFLDDGNMQLAVVRAGGRWWSVWLESS